VVKTGGTQKWQVHTARITAADLGDAKQGHLFFYHDAPATAASASPPSPCAASAGDGRPRATLHLTGDTNHPIPAPLSSARRWNFTFHRHRAYVDPARPSLRLRIVDEHDRVLQSKELPVRGTPAGKWDHDSARPGDKLGFYRVPRRLGRRHRTQRDLAGTRQRPGINVEPSLFHFSQPARFRDCLRAEITSERNPAGRERLHAAARSAKPLPPGKCPDPLDPPR